jgi:hypothetical protein
MSDDLLLKRLVNLLREKGLGEIQAESIAREIVAFFTGMIVRN